VKTLSLYQFHDTRLQKSNFLNALSVSLAQRDFWLGCCKSLWLWDTSA